MESPQTFDHCGLAALSDLDAPSCRELLAQLEAAQARFLAHESEFRGDDYPWPGDALHNWSRVWEYPYVHHHLLAERARLDRAARVVDVGSGVAFFPFLNAQVGCEVVCVDVDPICVRDLEKAIAVADAGGGSVAARQSSGIDVPVEEAWADILVCVSVLEHVDDPPALARAMGRAVRPGGLAILTLDLDLRGDQAISPAGREALMAALAESFELEHPMRTVHPRDQLQSTNGPHGFVDPPAWPLLRFRAKQWLRGLFGQPRRPLYPFELAVEGLVLRRRGAS